MVCFARWLLLLLLLLLLRLLLLFVLTSSTSAAFAGVQGELDAADNCFNLALLKQPRNTDALDEKKMIDLTRRRFDMAAQLLKTVCVSLFLCLSVSVSICECVSFLRVPHPSCFVCLVSQGSQLAKAYALVQNGLATSPESTKGLLLKAEVLIGLGKYDEAYATTTAIMRAGNQSDPDLLRVRAKCLFYQDNIENAIKHLQQALRSDPDAVACAKDLRKLRRLLAAKTAGNDFFKHGRWQDAVDKYTECLGVEPGNKLYNSKLHANRAAALMKLRKNAEAMEDLNRALALDDTYVKGYMRRAACASAIGGVEHLEQAMRDYESAKRLVRDPATVSELESNIRSTKAAIKQAKRKDYYKILGVDRDATEAQLKKAYRKAALKWHPDRHTSSTDEQKKQAEAMFKDVNEAYEVLQDATKRRRYDSGVDIEDLDNESPFGGGGMGGMGGVDIFSAFMGGGFGGGGGGGFGGGGGGRRRGGGMPFF